MQLHPVKRAADGEASTFRHDDAPAATTPPTGDYDLADNPLRPIVLLSGGVGLTPMVSMREVPAHSVHGTGGLAHHALTRQVRDAADRHGNVGQHGL